MPPIRCDFADQIPLADIVDVKFFVHTFRCKKIEGNDS